MVHETTGLPTRYKNDTIHSHLPPTTFNGDPLHQSTGFHGSKAGPSPHHDIAYGGVTSSNRHPRPTSPHSFTLLKNPSPSSSQRHLNHSTENQIPSGSIGLLYLVHSHVYIISPFFLF